MKIYRGKFTMFEPYSMETLILIGAGIGILIMTTIILICFVDPCCLCYKWTRKQRNKSGVANGTCGEGVYKDGYEMFTSESLGKQGGAHLSSLSIKRDSCYSSMSDTSEGIMSNIKFWNKSLYSTETDHFQLSNQAPPNDFYGEVTMRFLYHTNENQQVGKIFITVQNWYIKVTAYDDDKYGNPTELGYSDFPLKNALDKNCQEIIYKCCLKQPNRVHVLLLSAMGRILKRKKSSFGHGEKGQLFEETIPFHVQGSQMGSITCLLLLCAKAADVCRESSSSVSGDENHSLKTTREQLDQSDCEEGHNRKGSIKSKEHCIGKVILGATVRVPEGQSQWLSMIQRPRTAVSMWHKLR
ncbi:hypothetical protein J437_LFUL012512 [Ladona fulva]|uniref:Uncharacterized protein n=1 Tax=Ladona fulva TaxID=123851 RepID=A0A8K0NY79_LADFU|nr:hypothetical protein J437_LFUL012512 [Ladona fulva]